VTTQAYPHRYQFVSAESPRCTAHGKPIIVCVVAPDEKYIGRVVHYELNAGGRGITLAGCRPDDVGPGERVDL
jgi:hypothetical protein